MDHASPSYHEGGKRGLSGPINSNSCPCSPPRLPGCPGGGETEVPDTDRAKQKAGMPPDGQSMETYPCPFVTFISYFFPSISFKLSRHLSLFYPGSPKETVRSWPLFIFPCLGGDVMGGPSNLSGQILNLGNEAVHGAGKTICFPSNQGPFVPASVVQQSLERQLDAVRRG